MHLNNYVKSAILGAGCLLSVMPSASAMWPTLDGSTLAQNISNVVQQTQQKITQIKESVTVGLTNSALGSSVMTMAAQAQAGVEAAKKQAEKVQKAQQKLQEYKEEAERRKKEYEEKVSKYKEYEDKLNSAKAKYEEAKNKIDEAKDMVNDAKGMVNDAQAAAKGAIADAKGAVNDAKSAASAAASKVNEVKSVAGDVKNTASQATSLASQKVSGVTSAKTSTGQKAVASGSVSAAGKVSAGTVSASGVSAAGSVSRAVSGGSAMSASGSNAAVSRAQNNTLTSAGAATMQKATVTPSASIEKAGLSKEISAVDALDVDEVSEKALSAEEKLEKIKEISAEKGSYAAAQELQKTVSKATLARDTEMLEAVSKLDTADIVNSDSKIYDDTATVGRKAFTNARESMAADVVGTVSSAKDELKAAGTKAAAPLTAVSAGDSLKASVGKAVESPASIIKAPVSATPAATGNSLQINRRSFTSQPAALQKNSLWLDDGERARRSSIKTANSETLHFAAAEECEYANSITNGDDGEIVILSKTLAQQCCIKAENLTDLKVIKDCVNKILEKKLLAEDNETREDANEVYGRISAEQSSYGMLEALDNATKSVSYTSDVLVPYVDSMKSASTTRDNVSSISMTNAQILYLLNRIRRIYTSAAISGSLGALGGVTTAGYEEGLNYSENSDSEYDYSISRSEIEYPVLPENMARKCAIDIKTPEGVAKIKSCYFDIVKAAHAENSEQAKAGQDFIHSLQYQEALNSLAKGLFQKVKSAKYDERLDKTKEQTENTSTERTDNDALFNTDYEISELLDDMLNAYASIVAYNGLENLSRLRPESAYQPKPSSSSEG